MTAPVTATAEDVESSTDTVLPADIAELFEQHHARIFRVAFRVAGNATDAEDALQTIFLRLLRRSTRPNLAPNPGAYLHRAALNAALDIVRSRAAPQVVAIDDTSDRFLAADAGGRPDRQLANGELGDRLRRAIGKLPERHAEMFVLRYFEDQDLGTIARTLGTSKSTVAVTLFRTRSKLKRELATSQEKYDA